MVTLNQSTPPLLEVENLFVRFGRRSPDVVKGISFSLRRGECLALVGESGSGKSVTSRTLVGLSGHGSQVRADRLRLDGEDMLDFSERTWREIRGVRVGFVMQDALGSLDPLRLVGDEIGEALSLHQSLSRAQREEKVVSLLTQVGMPEPAMRARQYPHQLSGGLRQRALIASAIACGPELLIADEPTTALDATVQAHVLRLLESLRTPDNAMLIISHDLAVVSRLADRVAVMHDGVIVEQGTIEEVLHNPQHPYTRSLLAAHASVHAKSAHLPKVYPPVEPAARHGFIDGLQRPSGDNGRGLPLLEAVNLTKSFEASDGTRRTVVSDVSFVLRPGQAMGIVGESGSGKTTLIRMILGLEKPDSGEVFVKGSDWALIAPEQRRVLRRKIQVIFQDPLGSFDPRYTVWRVLEEALSVTGLPRDQRRARAIELLTLVRLPASILDRRPIELSGGQRQRVAIARALAPEPQVLVCDEPVSALDVSVQAQILDLLEDLRARLDLACLFISHDLGVIHRVCHRIVVMKDGKAVERGAVREVFDRPYHAYTRTLLEAIPRLEKH